MELDRKALIVVACLLGLAWPARAQPEVRLGQHRIAAGQSWSVDFHAPKRSGQQQFRLSLRARVDWPSPGGGSNPVMLVTVNQKTLPAARLRNKPVEFFMRDGSDASWVWGNTWRVVFCPDFSDDLRRLPLAVGIPDTDPFTFEWDITPETQPGRKNTLVIHHQKLLPDPVNLVVEDVRVRLVPASGAASLSTPPLSVNTRRGPERWISGGFRQAPAPGVELSPEGSMFITVGEARYEVQTRISLPGGQWMTTGVSSPAAVDRGATATFCAGDVTVSREVRVLPTRVQVVDRMRNASGELQCLILQHRFRTVPNGVVYLAGRKSFAATQQIEEPAHPTIFHDHPGQSLGLVAEDDIFRVHIRSFVDQGWAGLADPRLALGDGAERAVEWSIYGIGQGDYWDFVNSVRRDWKVNTTLAWPLPFESGTSSYTNQYAVSPARARWVTLQATFPDGKLAEGSAIPLAEPWCASIRQRVRDLVQTVPEGRVMMYFHGQICTEPDAMVRYADSRALQLDGEQVLSPYHYPVPVFVPTLTNSYGRALPSALDRSLSLTGARGVYWDELAYATERFVQAEPWDGCSAEIDPATHELRRLVSSVPLLKQSWDGKTLRWLRERGFDVVGNGPPFTRSMMDLSVPRIAETSSYRNLLDLHLCTPWGLANRELDGSVASHMRMTQRILDYGCVATPFHLGGKPLPWVNDLYPTTIDEIRSGVVMGRERIVTNRSGRFGWADGARFSVRVYGPQGQIVRERRWYTVPGTRDFQVELRLEPGELAVLIRPR
ncbi:MAG: hypothetical protein AB1758_00245 [Candidatus Eremiobacterota bacterium]